MGTPQRPFGYCGRIISGLRQARIENLSLISWIAVAVKRGFVGGIAIRIDGQRGSTWVQKGREIAANLVRRRDRGQLRQRLANAQTLVISEKERLVLDDGTAQGESELVLFIRLLTADVEGVDCVEFFVAQELPHVAMDLIGARLDDRVHDGAVTASEFGAVGIGLDLELGDGVHRGLNHIGRPVEHVAQIRIVVDTVEQEIILQSARAIGAEAGAWFRRGSRVRRAQRPCRAERVARSCARSTEEH